MLLGPRDQPSIVVQKLFTCMLRVACDLKEAALDKDEAANSRTCSQIEHPVHALGVSHQNVGEVWSRDGMPDSGRTSGDHGPGINRRRIFWDQRPQTVVQDRVG